jgi:uncharacterized membrane protein (UPF0127 family)
MPRFSFLVALCAAVCIALCVPLASCKDSPTLPKVTIVIDKADGTGTVPLVVEVARSEREQEKGYMERKEIPDGTGMIFAYEADQQMHFWMKNTPHPLSIAFIDAEGTLREIYDMEPFSLETVSSEHSVRYALEVPQGWFARAGLKAGDRLAKESIAAVTR